MYPTFEEDRTVNYAGPQGGMAHLRLLGPDGTMKNMPLGQRLTIGRNSASSQADFKFDLQFISSNHGGFYLTPSGYIYEDNNSRNGTFVNDELLKGADAQRKLKSGDVLRIGRNDVETLQNTPHRPLIMIFGQDDYAGERWQELRLQPGAELCIGRGQGANQSFDDKRISHKHASFFFYNNRWALVDHNSTNGSYLNNRRIEKPEYLAYGDCVRIVDHYFVFLGDRILFNVKPQPQSATPQMPMMHSPEEYVYTQNRVLPVGPTLSIYIQKKDTKRGLIGGEVQLKDIRMNIQSGESVLVIAGAGIDRMAFLSSVMGYEKADAKILHGGKNIYQEYENLKYQMGFVPSNPALGMSPDETVEGLIKKAAAFKCPKNPQKPPMNPYAPQGMQVAYDEQKVEEWMVAFGLTDMATLPLVSLQPQQKKQVYFVLQLLGSPTMLFVDEPDQNVVPDVAKMMLTNMKKYARKGNIVISTMANPDFGVPYFDKLVVLSQKKDDESGHLAYYGPMQGAFPYFECNSLNGIMRRVSAQKYGGEGFGDIFIEKHQNLHPNGF